VESAGCILGSFLWRYAILEIVVEGQVVFPELKMMIKKMESVSVE
jgi:hypothetical protein